MVNALTVIVVRAGVGHKRLTHKKASVPETLKLIPMCTHFKAPINFKIFAENKLINANTPTIVAWCIA